MKKMALALFGRLRFNKLKLALAVSSISFLYLVAVPWCVYELVEFGGLQYNILHDALSVFILLSNIFTGLAIFTVVDSIKPNTKDNKFPTD